MQCVIARTKKKQERHCELHSGEATEAQRSSALANPDTYCSYWIASSFVALIPRNDVIRLLRSPLAMTCFCLYLSLQWRSINASEYNPNISE
ncbi:MAG: hypothetical protein LBH30_03255 [Prevotellaceae bacterium]|nr:hypothetical protein [Prevotellaceae bacterium]